MQTDPRTCALLSRNRTAASALAIVKVGPVDARVRWWIPFCETSRLSPTLGTRLL
jgi:hypothetical protein